MEEETEEPKTETSEAGTVVVTTEGGEGEELKLNTSIQPNDIVFDCPHCGKSMAIDAEGAGMAITCPDCQNVIQVPYPDTMAAETAADRAPGKDAVRAQDTPRTDEHRVGCDPERTRPRHVADAGNPAAVKHPDASRSLVFPLLGKLCFQPQHIEGQPSRRHATCRVRYSRFLFC
ncbi:MAG: hypothetical protein NTY53_07795 [Kiritimatiellaeota bacterium]|nr:hypothetical protein [Kiritimatiellota bacterium]